MMPGGQTADEGSHPSTPPRTHLVDAYGDQPPTELIDGLDVYGDPPPTELFAVECDEDCDHD